MRAHQAGKFHKSRHGMQGRRRCRLHAIWIAAFVFTNAALAENEQAFEPLKSDKESSTPARRAAHARLIWPQMRLDEALQAFEGGYSVGPAESFHDAGVKGAENLIKDLSVMSAKLFAASKEARRAISLRPYIRPVPLSPLRLQRWRDGLPHVLGPPQVSHQTFVVTLNGKAYVIAPGHGTRGDKRYYTPPKSDTSVRLASKEEAGHTIPLDRKPPDLFGKIVTLEGKLHTGEIVKFQSAAVRGSELLQVLLPDARASFHSWNRGVEVGYERTLVFVLPVELSRPSRFGIHRTSGFSGAPAIEITPQGDAIAGHYIGQHTLEIDGAKITFGVLEDYEQIRSAVERFAALPRKELSRAKN